MARQLSSKLMECLACPFSKEALRFCAKSNALINDSMGVSYPVIDGIPYLAPTFGQLLSTQDSSENKSLSEVDVTRQDSYKSSSEVNTSRQDSSENKSSSEANVIEKGFSSTGVAWHKKD